MLLQVVLEALAELGLHSLRESFRRPTSQHVWLAAIGYSILGALAGGVSLFFFPVLFIEGEALQFANVIITPIAAGAIMGLFGAWRQRRGEDIIRLDKFSYAFLFALAMGGVRFVFGQ
jgi:hypothetical protein